MRSLSPHHKEAHAKTQLGLAERCSPIDLDVKPSPLSSSISVEGIV